MITQNTVNPPINQPQDVNQVNSNSIPTPQKPRSRLLILLFVLFIGVVFTLIGILVYIFISQRIGNRLSPVTTISTGILPSLPPSSQPVPTTVLSDKSILVGSFQIFVPKDWSVSISTKTNTILAARFYSPVVNPETSYLEVQVGPSNQFSPNETLVFGPDIKVTTPITYIQREGKEKLMQSNRKVLQMEKEVNNSKCLLTLYGADQDLATQRGIVEQIMNHVVPPQVFRLVKSVYAQASSNSSAANPVNTITGFSLSDWKTIDVMEGPYPERITTADHQYKDGYARLYKFTHLRGQRLEILAEESKEDLKNVGSFIEQELYDSSGQLVMKAQTRLSLPVSFTQSETGDFFLLVKSFQGKQGKFLLKIFDLDQVNDLYSLRYADGSEVQLNGQQQYKNLPAVLIVRLTNPVEVVGNNSFRYFRKTDNACIECGTSAFFGDKTIPMTITTTEGEIPIKITKMFLNQLLIQPASQESFDAGKNYSFGLDYGEDPSVPGMRGGYGGSFRTL